MSMSGNAELLVDRLVFPEGPRWRDGRLWFSDMEDGRVHSVSLSGDRREEVKLDDYTSGLGWLPDGTLLVVSVRKQKLMSLRDGQLQVHADLSRLALSFTNDMVVDPSGRAYVGSMGFDVWSSSEPQPGNLCMVQAEGAASIVAENLGFPNGAVITPDGKTLIVAESLGGVLTAFSVSEDGSLHDRRPWASTGERSPDGTCMDEAGGIWIACPRTGTFARFIEGGEQTHLIELPEGQSAYAVALGGEDGRSLFLLVSSPLDDSHESRMAKRPGKILTARAPYRAA